MDNLKIYRIFVDNRYTINFFVYIAMKQELNIKILENRDCGITATDYTSYSGPINSVFIEFVVKDESIIYNIVREVNTPEDVPTTTEILITEDGLYTYHKLIIPTLEYYRGEDSSYNVANKCFYYNQKIYKSDVNITLDQINNCEKITNISDMLGLVDGEDISYYTEDFFILCRLRNCFLQKINTSLLESIKVGCNSECIKSSENMVARDFMIASLSVLDWLIANKDYDEAKRILNILKACNNYLCLPEYNSTIGGCNCGKS